MTPSITTIITLAGTYTTAMDTAYGRDRLQRNLHHACAKPRRFSAMRTLLSRLGAKAHARLPQSQNS